MFLVPLAWALSLDHSDLNGIWATGMALTLIAGLLMMVLTVATSANCSPVTASCW